MNEDTASGGSQTDITLSEVDESELSDAGTRAVTPPAPAPAAEERAKATKHQRAVSYPKTTSPKRPSAQGKLPRTNSGPKPAKAHQPSPNSRERVPARKAPSPPHHDADLHTPAPYASDDSSSASVQFRQPVAGSPHDSSDSGSSVRFKSAPAAASRPHRSANPFSDPGGDSPPWLQLPGKELAEDRRMSDSSHSPPSPDSARCTARRLSAEDPGRGGVDDSVEVETLRDEIVRVRKQRDDCKTAMRAVEEKNEWLAARLQAAEERLFDFASDKATWAAEREKADELHRSANAQLEARWATQQKVLGRVVSEQASLIAERDAAMHASSMLYAKVHQLSAEHSDMRAAMEEAYCLVDLLQPAASQSRATSSGAGNPPPPAKKRSHKSAAHTPAAAAADKHLTRLKEAPSVKNAARATKPLLAAENLPRQHAAG
ncbi:hypothetical protein DIPPA_25783 [Diplonema papillatum]|nr:hypothetical protein DIPPA_25783 [Diplonema papillatum]